MNTPVITVIIVSTSVISYLHERGEKMGCVYYSLHCGSEEGFKYLIVVLKKNVQEYRKIGDKAKISQNMIVVEAVVPLIRAAVTILLT